MPKRVDANQAIIVDALRCAGAFVQTLHETGKGCPDLLVSYHGDIFVMEVKTLFGKMTKAEKRWFDEWQADYYIIHNVEEAIRAITE